MSRGLALRRLVVLAVLVAAVVAGFLVELPEQQPPISADGSPMGQEAAYVRTDDGGFKEFEAVLIDEAVVIDEVAAELVLRVKWERSYE